MGLIKVFLDEDHHILSETDEIFIKKSWMHVLKVL